MSRTRRTNVLEVFHSEPPRLAPYREVNSVPKATSEILTQIIIFDGGPSKNDDLFGRIQTIRLIWTGKQFEVAVSLNSPSDS
jgi:hypothetical protein